MRGAGGKSRALGGLVEQPWGPRVQLQAEDPVALGQRRPERPWLGQTQEAARCGLYCITHPADTAGTFSALSPVPGAGMPQ